MTFYTGSLCNCWGKASLLLLELGGARRVESWTADHHREGRVVDSQGLNSTARIFLGTAAFFVAPKVNTSCFGMKPNTDGSCHLQ